jgi:hypothetical protein
MRTLKIEAVSLASARDLCDALSGFQVELVATESGSYEVKVALGMSDRDTARVLGAIEDYITKRGTDPARLEIDGHSYAMHATHG